MTQLSLTFVHTHGLNPVELMELMDLVNVAYREIEEGLWVEPWQRVYLSELNEFIAKRQLVVAKIKGQVVGCIIIHEESKQLIEFRMLVVHPKFRHLGIGKKLIQFVENHGIQNGFSTIQLVVISPQFTKNSPKAILTHWYESLGFEKQKTCDAKEALPELTAIPKVKCKFIVFQKPLPG